MLFLSSCVKIDAVIQRSVIVCFSILSVPTCFWFSHWIYFSRVTCSHISTFSRPENYAIFKNNLAYSASHWLLFHVFANSLMSSMYIRWLIFSCDPLSLNPAMHFLSMWLSGIMAIMNSKGDSASPWKIPLWIFVSAKPLPPAASFTLQVCKVFSMKFMTSCDILYILRQCIIQLCGTISYAFS